MQGFAALRDQIGAAPLQRLVGRRSGARAGRLGPAPPCGGRVQAVGGHRRDREDGGYLTRAWQGAIATNPTMVIVTSYNETFEHTEIRPSPQWGDLYLDLNRQLGDSWRAVSGAAPYGASSG